jgi:hypothetical protein
METIQAELRKSMHYLSMKKRDHAADKIDALQAQVEALTAELSKQEKPVRPMSETTAWLIELNIANAPCWLTGTGAYTNDANEALQFVREIDAKAMLDVYMGAKFGKEIIGIYKRHFAPENYRVTEHIFHGIKGATA